MCSHQISDVKTEVYIATIGLSDDRCWYKFYESSEGQGLALLDVYVHALGITYLVNGQHTVSSAHVCVLIGLCLALQTLLEAHFDHVVAENEIKG